MYSDVTDSDDGVPLPEISGYRLLRVLNHGGMSTVYLARQHALSRDVAIKVMSLQALSDEVSRRRFENEVRTIARLEHPNVVRIHEVGRTDDGLPYYAMPYMPRGHLGQRDFSKSETRVLAVVQSLLSALEYAHARGVVHRDVKAENVLFDEAERPLLADFGIALRRGFGPRMTAAGLAVGSTAYMAPEQARGEDVDGRADLYSLAVLIWEMLTGHLPFEAGDALSMAVMHAQDPIPKLPERLHHWQWFMNRGLAKQPAQRFQNVAQMRDAIAAVQRRSPWPQLSLWFNSIGPLQSWAKPIWIAGSALAVIAVGVLLFKNNSRDQDFFRAETTAAAPIADAVVVPTAEPAISAAAQQALDTARRQIAQQHLTTPVDANAYASVLEAWHADSTHPEVSDTVASLTDALADELVSNLRDGNDQRARDYFVHATTLGQQTGSADSKAQIALREQVTTALQARLERAVKRYDRDDAQRVVQLASDFALPPTVIARLTAQAKATPVDDTALRGGSVVAEGKAGMFAIGRRPVSRSDYARFARTTGRTPTLCRERVSLLRVIAPRDWRSPGFSQGEGEPVVCVSLDDAEAYAKWYSQQTGHRYRLPSASEARQAAAQVSGRDLSMWLRDCAGSCQQHVANGASWRSSDSQRSLSVGRGYDDVGFRLVREL